MGHSWTYKPAFVVVHSSCSSPQSTVTTQLDNPDQQVHSASTIPSTYSPILSLYVCVSSRCTLGKSSHPSPNFVCSSPLCLRSGPHPHAPSRLSWDDNLISVLLLLLSYLVRSSRHLHSESFIAPTLEILSISDSKRSFASSHRDHTWYVGSPCKTTTSTHLKFLSEPAPINSRQQPASNIRHLPSTYTFTS